MVAKSIIIYTQYLPKVGGIESATYNLIQSLSDSGFDVAFVYQKAESAEPLFKISQYANVKQLTEEVITADICIITSNHKLPKQIIAQRYIQWIHSDYRMYNIELANRDNKEIEYVAVTQHCADVAKELFGIDSTVIMNFPDKDFGQSEKRQLKLCTVTRLSPEKGMNRMYWLACKLKELDIPFIWLVVGDNSKSQTEEMKWRNKFKDIEEVSFLGYKKDPSYYMKWADYTVLLSDFEGCPLALLESLYLGTPVITTDWAGSWDVLKYEKMPVCGFRLPLDIQKTRDEDLLMYANTIPCNIHYDFDTEKKKWVKLLSKKK